MIDFSNVEIVNFGDSDTRDRLVVLFTTPAGSVVFDREFGIDTSIIDAPLPVAQTRLVAEYAEKVKRYEPGVAVEEVTFIEGDTVNGQLIPRVVIVSD